MLPAPEPIRLAVPPGVDPPAAPAFPWVATIAPVAMAVVLFLVTRTPATLMFAALGPVVAVGAAVDGRRGRRRAARQAIARDDAERARLADRVSQAQFAEHERLLALTTSPGSGAVLLGRGRVRSAVDVDGLDPSDARHRMLCAAAEDPRDAPVVVDAADGIGISGAPVLARAVARALAAQLAGQGADIVAHEDGFRCAGVRIAWAAAEEGLPDECRVRVDVDSGGVRGPGVRAQSSGFRPQAITLAEWDARALTGRRATIPDRVDLADLVQPAADGLLAVLGRDAGGDVAVDLIADGPHALVAGTTGSGKSELLVSWILALASTRPPSRLSFLLIDFKGGAAFAPLAGLPHVTGILSDLDPRLTRRAVESLRAEVLRRERLLAAAGARSLDDLAAGGPPRLVIVVDEFAALVSSSPGLHEVFGDLAARGRSLGLHLILCTQRPAGVVRDVVLANIGLRICLRVTDRADSVAMTGDDSAARLPAEPRGRAVLQRDGVARTLQVAVSTALDARRIAEHSDPGIPERPWLDPLPRSIRLGDVPPSDEPGRRFGVLDLAGEQRQPAAVYDPARHGHALVLGAAGAGATTALATLCAGGDAVVVSADPADAWAQLGAHPAEGLLVIDGLDTLVAAAGSDLGHDLVERLAVLLRGRSPAVVVSARRLDGPLGGIAGLFGSRLLLRQSSRDEHLLAGGASDDYDPALPPGAGTWRGTVIQVADCGLPLPEPDVPVLPRVVPGAAPVLAIVASRPGAVDPGQGVRVVRLGRQPPPNLGTTTGGRPTVLLGDPDAWQSEWSLLTEVRRSSPIALIGCTAADHRALLREAVPPPPLGGRPGECWLSCDGATVRALFDPAPARESEEKHPWNR